MSVADHLEKLIAFDTVSATSNLDLIAYIEAQLAAHGIASWRVPDASGEKASLLATIGDPSRPGLVLSGHTDVVPVEGQAWSSDPFKAVMRDEKIYGRGAVDMKGFLAVMLDLVPVLAERSLSVPVHLAFSYDEEVGCRATKDLVEALLQSVERPLGCVVGEPTLMGLVDGHKGKIGLRCRIEGREGHSALPHKAANAVLAAGRLVAFLADEAERLALEGPFVDGFEPAHGTINVGRIAGGTAVNIVPRACVFEMEYRFLPGQSAQEFVDRLEAHALNEVLPALRRTAPEAAISFETILSYPGFAADADAPFSKRCQQVLGQEAPARKVSFGTEAGWFAHYGIPTMVCGPGDIDVAHRPDEHVSLAQLARSRQFLLALIEDAQLN